MISALRWSGFWHPALPLDIPTPGTFGVLDLPSLSFGVYRAEDGREIDIISRLGGVA